MNPKDLLNWGAVSRLLCGARTTMTRKKIPKIHQPTINTLLSAMEKALEGKGKKQQ